MACALARAGKAESTLQLVERAGLPSQDHHPDCPGGKVDLPLLLNLHWRIVN